MKQQWHCRNVSEIVEHFSTNIIDGLTTSEVEKRLDKIGYNELRQVPNKSLLLKFILQFQDFMVLVLLGATLISALLGEYVDALTILAIVMVNAILGFIQEYRAEQSLSALKKLSAPHARVIRNGVVQRVPTCELVPGDVLLLESGDKVAADARIVDTQNLEVEESALTGESLPVRKSNSCKLSDETPAADRTNMVYAATSVTRGRGKAIVCSTGMQTEVGRIADLLQNVQEEKTPLEKRLDRLGKWLVWACLFICLVVVITGVIKGESLFLMCMAGISLAVAAIPEGLPAIVTVSLALGMQRMIKRNAIVRKLPAVETLGCVTAICSDKTGTLTQNAMTVRKIMVDEKTYEMTGSGYNLHGELLLNGKPVEKADYSLHQCLLIGCLCNNSILKRNKVGISGLWRNIDEKWEIEGDPTEGALIVAAGKLGIWRDNIEKNQTRVAEIPFESERKRMSVIYRDKTNQHTVYLKGAPDTILEKCRYYLQDSRRVDLNENKRQELMQQVDELAKQSLRILAVAFRSILPAEAARFEEQSENNLIFAGLIGMIDPPRTEAKHAIMLCKQAGIKTIMITGDHKNTAMAIAEELKMIGDKELALTGNELDSLTDKQLGEMVDRVAVYARVSPTHKLRIVKALKKRGHIVAMTGDGVNDAPAIKEADIGIAMGLSGTEVTKEASSIILADDNFATIVAAVEEGRGIYDNIRKFIRYLLACNLGEVLTMFGASLVGFPLPMIPVQVLWVNLVTDGLPAMALGIDPKDQYIMQRPPRSPGESAFSRGLSKKILARGFQIGVSSLAVFAFAYFYRQDLVLARTMSLTTLVFCQMFHVFDCRSEIQTVFEYNLGTNRYLVLAVLCSILMQVTLIYHPILQTVFSTKPIMAFDWGIILMVSGWTFIVAAIKRIIRGKKIRQPSFIQ